MAVQEKPRTERLDLLTTFMCMISDDFRSSVKSDLAKDLLHDEARRVGLSYDALFQAYEEDWEGRNNRWSACRYKVHDRAAQSNKCDYMDVHLMDVKDFIQRHQTGETYKRPAWVAELEAFREKHPRAAGFLQPYNSTSPDERFEANFRRLQNISQTYGVSMDELGEILEGTNHKLEWWMDFDNVNKRNSLNYTEAHGQGKIDIVLELMESGVAPPSCYEDVFTITALKKQDLGITNPYQVVDLDIHDVRKYMNTPRFHAHKAAQYPFASNTSPYPESRLS